MNKEKAALLLGTLAVGVLVGTVTTPDPHPDCFEDQVMIWDGRTDDHTICWNWDDIVDLGIEVAIQDGIIEFSK